MNKMNLGQDISAFQKKNSAHVYKLSDSRFFRSARVPITTYTSSWWPQLGARLDELCSLQNGWDGYDGRPVPYTLAKFAGSLLESLCITGLSFPALVPGSDGSLQIEWHKNGYDVEIDILAPNLIVASRFNHSSGKEETIELENDASILLGWMHELATAEVKIEAASA